MKILLLINKRTLINITEKLVGAYILPPAPIPDTPGWDSYMQESELKGSLQKTTVLIYAVNESPMGHYNWLDYSYAFTSRAKARAFAKRHLLKGSIGRGIAGGGGHVLYKRVSAAVINSRVHCVKVVDLQDFFSQKPLLAPVAPIDSRYWLETSLNLV